MSTIEARAQEPIPLEQIQTAVDRILQMPPNREAANDASRDVHRNLSILQSPGNLAPGRELPEQEQRAFEAANAALGETLVGAKALAESLGISLEELHTRALVPDESGLALSHALSRVCRATEQRYDDRGGDLASSYAWKGESADLVFSRLEQEGGATPAQAREAHAFIEEFKNLPEEQQEHFRSERQVTNELFSLWYACTNSYCSPGQAGKYHDFADHLEGWCRQGGGDLASLKQFDLPFIAVVADGNFGKEGRGNARNYYPPFDGSVEMARRMMRGEAPDGTVIFTPAEEVKNGEEKGSSTLLVSRGGVMYGNDFVPEKDQGGAVNTGWKQQDPEQARYAAVLAAEPAAKEADAAAAAAILADLQKPDKKKK